MESNTWLERQTGTIQQWEKVTTTFLNEDTGEMYCVTCGKSEMTRSNRSRSFLVHINQGDAFEMFTERHLHGKEV